MNTLIVYDSRFGNTEQIVQSIANTLYEGGLVRTVRVEHTHPLELQGVDLLIIGCPTQEWRPTPAMRSLLEYISPAALSRMTVACFDTRLDQPRWMTGSAAEQMTKKLRKMGVAHLFPPQSFLVKGIHGPLANGEVERASTWAHTLLEKVNVKRVTAQ